MPKDTVTAQQFDKPIVIQKPVDTDDGQGGSTRGWVQVYPVDLTRKAFADIQNFPHGRGLVRQFFAQQLYPSVSTVIAMRFQNVVHIDASMRIVYVKGPITHLYQILGIENPGEANISFLFFCKEYQSGGYN